jgi:ABC-type multidrug transport system ATPase subunit
MNDRRILLRMARVEKRYGRRKVLAIDDFQLAAGDRILLTGANGSGKSTLLRVLAGVTPISRGELHRSPDLSQMVVGYVPQSGGLYSDMTLRQNLAIFSRMYDTQPGRPAEDVWFVRDTVLRSFIDIRVGEFSGGMHQLATFACVISAGPHALLLDEPTSELDSVHAGQIHDCLALLCQGVEFIILSSHEARDFNFITRRLVMEDGRIVS